MKHESVFQITIEQPNDLNRARSAVAALGYQLVRERDGRSLSIIDPHRRLILRAHLTPAAALAWCFNEG